MARIPIKERKYWIDYAKTIGIFYIVLGHLPIQDKMFESFFYTFHLPLFFILSGYLSRKNDCIEDEIKNNFRTLIIPYFYFYLLKYLYWIPGYIHHPELFPDRNIYGFLVKPFLGMAFGVGYDTAYSTMCNVPIWFLVGLFFCKNIFAWLWSTCKGNHVIVTAVIVALVVLVEFLKMFHIFLLFSVSSAMMALPFYYIGFLLKDFKFNRVEENIPLAILVFIVTLTGTILCTGINGRPDMNYLNNGSNIFIYYLAGCVGTVMLSSLSMILARVKTGVIVFISANTLTIFAIHGIVVPIVLKITDPIWGHAANSDFGLVYAHVVSFLTLAVSVIPILIINKYFPFMLGKRKLAPSTDV